MRVLWATDIHLTFVTERIALDFCRRLTAQDVDAMLLTGDIAEGTDLERWLLFLEEHLPFPIYFVLGNHDFYGSSIARTRALAERLSTCSEHLKWLCGSGVLPLTEKACLVGHGSWGDGRFGQGRQSRLMLNDFIHIEELRGLSRDDLFDRLGALGDEAAAHLDRVVPEALASYRHVVVLTHAPPFREACLHDGHVTDESYLPHFACRAVGDRLLHWMTLHPHRRMTVLSGHTHTRGVIPILPNLTVRTGAAEYGLPTFEAVLQVP